MNFQKNASSILIARSIYFSKNLKSNAGFFKLYLLFFISLLATFMFAFGFIFYASQSKESFRKVCITQATELQKSLITSEQKLFLLNTPSTILRLQLAALYASLLVTPPPADIGLISEIEETESLQEQLDQTQKMIIKTAQAKALIDFTKLVTESNANNLDLKKNWTFYLYILTATLPLHLPQLAVRPDSLGGTAPNYELETDYENKQRVELKWHNLFSLKQNAQEILRPSGFFNEASVFNYELICNIQPERRNSAWGLKINLGKR
jgi:hypothetical protein